MAETLLLRLPRSIDQPATWLVVDSRGAPIGPPQGGPLSLAAARTGGRRICVLVPGTEVLLAEPEVPAKAGVKLAQLVPYALEEQLAEDIEDLHFAIGKRAEAGRVPVAVVARSLMDDWLALLKSQNIKPDLVVVDSELLPHDPGHSIALLEEEAVVARPPNGSPITLPVDALDEALEAVQTPAEMSEGGVRGLILYTGAAEWHQHSPAVERLRSRFDGVRVQLLTGGPLGLFAQQLPLTSPINLLQGPYAPQSSAAGAFQPWRTAATLLVAICGLHLVGKAAELTMLKRHERQLDTAIRQTFRSAMQQDAGVASARRLMEQRLIEVRGESNGLLAALEALVQARGSVPGSLVKSLSFHDNLIHLKVSAPDAASLERICTTLRGNGWQADLEGGNHVGQGYEGSIQIRTGA